MAHPILDRLSEPKVRWWIAGGVVVLALALGGFALAGRGGADAEADDGSRLNIAVVAPIEPAVQPGEVMDVGRLNDGFDGQMPEPVQQTAAEPDLYAEQPAYVEDDRSWRSNDRREDDRRYEDRAYDAPQKPDDRGQREAWRGRPMSFGFDEPRPDWRAEREARRQVLEARERERNERRERRYSSSGDLPQDSQFY
jgi:hypothetical protein